MHHQGPISGIAHTGAYIATAGYDNQLILWEAETRRAISRSLHGHLINQCAFSNDGRLLVSASSDYSARIWEVPSLRLKAALVGHADDVDMAVFSPDDKLVATCALDRVIRIFDLEGHCLKTMHGHVGNILSVAWSSDGLRLVSSSVDGTVREWDIANGCEVRCNDIDVRTDTLAIDAVGRIIAGDDFGRIVVIIDGRISYVQAHKAGVKKVIYDEASKVLATLSYDRTIAMWQLDEQMQPSELSRSTFPSSVWPRSGVFIDADRIAVGTFGSSYAIYDWRADRWDLDGIVADISLNAVAVAGDSVYAVGDAGTVLCDDEPATELGSLCNFLLAADNRLFSGGQLGQLFDARTGAVLYRHHSPLNCGAAFVRGGQTHIVVGAYTGEALVFAMRSDGGLDLVAELKIYENAIKGLAANDQLIFSVCASTAVAWHDIDTLKLVRMVPRAHERIANGGCLAGPRGFASIGRDRKLRIWEGDQVQTIETPHPNSIKCICASADRNLLMTGAYTGTLAGFDMTSRTWYSFARPTSAGISSIAYDHRHGYFLASSYDGRIYVVN
ncbi:WD40 repeat domain-containing protein [Noviherbaspirillum sp.]|uniref:WD40 repeat domain-containing protein n=1 Tax=Noviherbaspirillum sp. TaxID=1926288 RepID=UPI002B46D257|nr:WD40 repeat domain-containing protein [Noviherbaspirillum sp.]